MGLTVDLVPHLRKYFATLGMSRFAHSNLWQEALKKIYNLVKILLKKDETLTY